MAQCPHEESDRGHPTLLSPPLPARELLTLPHLCPWPEPTKGARATPRRSVSFPEAPITSPPTPHSPPAARSMPKPFSPDQNPSAANQPCPGTICISSDVPISLYSSMSFEKGLHPAASTGVERYQLSLLRSFLCGPSLPTRPPPGSRCSAAEAELSSGVRRGKVPNRHAPRLASFTCLFRGIYSWLFPL